jgi:hypothetical protein
VEQIATALELDVNVVRQAAQVSADDTSEDEDTDIEH